MSPDPHPTQADAFIADLAAFRVSCGNPTLRQVSAMVDRLGDLYGPQYKKLPPLSVTALSDILGGRRRGLPSWERVLSIVLACQRHKVDTTGLPADPGVQVLPDWLERWTRAADADLAEAAGLEVPQLLRNELVGNAGGWGIDAEWDQETQHRVRQAIADRGCCRSPGPGDPLAQDPAHTSSTGRPIGSDLVLRVLANRGLTHLIAFDPSNIEPVYIGGVVRRLRVLTSDPLSLTAARYHDLFGDHALDLLRSAEAEHDCEAAARLGILLVCTECPVEAHAWLERAAHGGDVMALALLAAPAVFTRGLAVELAYEIALQEADRPWEIIPDAETCAEVYGKAAADRGHPGAAHWLAVRHRARDDLAGAVRWFQQAVSAGHRQAAADLTVLQAQIRADQHESDLTAEIPNRETPDEPSQRALPRGRAGRVEDSTAGPAAPPKLLRRRVRQQPA